ncbi:hypothetical protein PFISCL1PPCAC_3565, partial [Pristionchus fissidentatus]
MGLAGESAAKTHTVANKALTHTLQHNEMCRYPMYAMNLPRCDEYFQLEVLRDPSKIVDIVQILRDYLSVSLGLPMQQRYRDSLYLLFAKTVSSRYHRQLFLTRTATDAS